MEHAYYFPDSIAERLKWLNIFHAQIAVEGPGLGFTSGQITAIQAYIMLMINAILDADTAMQVAQQKVSDRDSCITTNVETLRQDVQTIKDKTAYTDAIGKSLGIIGSEIKIDFDTVKTVVKLKKTQDGIDIKFGLEHCEGGKIYCMRGKETEFTFLAQVTHPHYIDTRTNLDDMATEKRYYKIILIYNDKAVGVDSDVAEITR